MQNKKSIPRLVEIVFDLLYLSTVLAFSVYYLSGNGSTPQLLWGLMSAVLLLGDACHLVPRIISVIKPQSGASIAAMGRGKLAASITMTVFYLIIWHAGILIFDIALPAQTILVYILAIARIIICALPSNGWTQAVPSPRFAILRNIPFFAQGAMVLWLYASYGNAQNGFSLMWLAILLSFAFYLPVVLFSHRLPKIGMLMLPKSCAYIWIICMGLSLV